MTTTLHPTPASAPARALPFLRMGSALVLAAHGAIHAMGTVLLWGLAEPGELRAADAVPQPGTLAGWLVGGWWALAGALFVVAAGSLLAHRRVAGLAAVAALVSLPPIVLMAAQAPVGIAVDIAILVIAAIALRRRRGAR